jgi:hypothetical protein
MAQIQTSRYSYSYEEFMKYQQINNVLPKQMVDFCVEYHYDNLPSIIPYEDQINDIINNITKGNNPNDVIFRNTLKFYINTMNHNNYLEYLHKLKNLDYSTLQNVQFLITELIKCTISCPIAYKGMNLKEETKQKTVPEICVDILKQLTQTQLKVNNTFINIHTDILSICRQYFVEYLDINKTMDEHNTYNSDNYKGFMTFMGLLYGKNIIPHKIIIDCINMIKNTIFCVNQQNNNYICKRSNIECTNFYKGYEYIVSHVIHTLITKIPELNKSNNEKELNIKHITTIINQIKENKHHDQDVKYIINKTLRSLLDESDYNLFTIEQLDIQVKTYAELKLLLVKFSDTILLKILDSELKHATDMHKNINATFDKIYNIIDTIIDQHQNIYNLNLKYKTIDTNNQMTSPLKPYLLSIHATLGNDLNNLHSCITHMHKCNKMYKC